MSSKVKVLAAFLTGLAMGWGSIAAAQSYISAYKRSMTRRMIADLRYIAATTIEYERQEGIRAVPTADIESFAAEIRAKTGKRIPTRDIFGQPLLVAERGGELLVFSTGTNGALLVGSTVVRGMAP